MKNDISWKDEARQAYGDQQSQDTEGGCGEPVGFVCGYLEGRRSSQVEIDITNSILTKCEFRLAHTKAQNEELRNLVNEIIDNMHNYTLLMSEFDIDLWLKAAKQGKE